MLQASETAKETPLKLVPSRTSLHCAVSGGNCQSVRAIMTWMLPHLQSQDALGLTAADMALLAGRPKLAALLMVNGLLHRPDGRDFGIAGDLLG
jgi:hypothetical protein